MQTINFNLTRGQLLLICEGLNVTAKQMEELIAKQDQKPRNQRVPAQTLTVWHSAARERYGMTKEFLLALASEREGKLNPHVPVVLDHGLSVQEQAEREE